MKILVVGGGGREHAIIKKLRENLEVREVYALPGNGGISLEAVCKPIGAKELEKIRDFAVSKAVDFAVVAPDDPLVLGCVDILEAAGIPCFGPGKAAAIIEGSKVFAKWLMKKYGIPTASYEVFGSAEEAVKYAESCETFPMVIKADGLALGKGVIIAETKAEALDAIRSIMLDRVFGESGSRVVIEEFLTGPEVTVLSFTDGKTIVPMVSSMDHKRAQHRRHGHDSAESLLHEGSRPKMYGGDFSPDDKGNERRGAHLQGLPLLRAHAHRKRSQGN
jgi:phosphoribosylamine--glycine ligase